MLEKAELDRFKALLKGFSHGEADRLLKGLFGISLVALFSLALCDVVYRLFDREVHFVGHLFVFGG